MVGFSALQRAENSSIRSDAWHFCRRVSRFSALQRAENSSIVQSRRVHNRCALVSVLFSEPKIPQSPDPSRHWPPGVRFSALQRAENSSMFRCWRMLRSMDFVSVLFSEPKIPQSDQRPLTPR